MIVEQVWIDHCNIAWMDTDHPDEIPASTKMFCGESFDRVYHKDEVVVVEGWARRIDHSEDWLPDDWKDSNAKI